MAIIKTDILKMINDKLLQWATWVSLIVPAGKKMSIRNAHGCSFACVNED